MNSPKSGEYRSDPVIPAHTHLLCTTVLIHSVAFFQAGQSSTVIENIHTIIAAAAVKFSFDQLTHLFVLIQKVVLRSGLVR